MSLVAYYSSDEEEGSDAEENTESQKKQVNEEQKVSKNSASKITDVEENSETADSFPIEDDEYDFIPNQTSGLTLPPPRNVTDSTNSVSFSTTNNQATSVLSALPTPQSKTGNAIGFNENDELEDEVKPKAKELADAPLPPSKQKKKQPVKITVPSLDDYDSDEDRPKKKKLKPAEGKSGLFSVLPAPKHGTSKEVGRVLLPHSLKKKPPAASAAKKPSSMATSKPATNSGFNNRAAASNDDSDDDDDGNVNFFSFGQEDTPVVPSVNIMPDIADRPLATGRTASTGLLHEPSLRGPWLGPAAPSDLLGPSMQPAGRSAASVNVASKSNVNMDIEGPGAQSSRDDEQGPSQPHQYNTDYGQSHYPEVGEVQSFMQDEEFLKMQGKRGRQKEEINIIDVHGADQMSQVDLMKHMTEERDNRSFGKKGKDMPSSQQRKKHQITYLAHQAKEREIELKNQWASNRQTRQQTQSKYGF